MSPSAEPAGVTQTPLDATLASAVRWVVPCATLPLLFGVVAFVGWLICYWNFYHSAERWFIVMGVGAIAVGCVALLVGGTVLIGRISQARQLAALDERRRVIMHTGFLGTLLVINFPLTFFMGVVAVGAFPSAVVHVDNRSGKTITDVGVVAEKTYELGNALGRRVTRFRFRPDERFQRLAGVVDDVEVELAGLEAFEPVAGGPRVWITVSDDGTVTVDPRSAMPSGQ